MLHYTGVLPWAVWGDGELPYAWWDSADFLSAVARWQHDARMRALVRSLHTALR